MTRKTTEYTALYRKYRPQSFAEVRGQNHVVKALTGAIKTEAVPHALLFAGGRGTGKTTVARIFASEIGTKDVDTYEIDAASNRGIDDIRELKEAVYTLPYESKQKVYIVDEVHMLTKEAFNALLKILEEPPAHVVFILATTEIEKLLDTITSRCQVFTFKAPTRVVLREEVAEVVKKEKFKLTKDGADLIAIAADGSFRDALGITQKVIMASSDKSADADEVADIIGAPKGALVMELIEALHKGETDQALGVVRAVVEENVDMKLFMKLLLERVRAVMLARHAKSDAEALLVQFVEEDQKKIESLARDSKSPVNSHLLLRLLTAADQTGRTYLPQLPLELAIVELSLNTKDTKKSSA